MPNGKIEKKIGTFLPYSYFFLYNPYLRKGSNCSAPPTSSSRYQRNVEPLSYGIAEIRINQAIFPFYFKREHYFCVALGAHYIGSNCCTKTIKLHPVHKNEHQKKNEIFYLSSRSVSFQTCGSGLIKNCQKSQKITKT